jgi:hypothetical protein
MIASCLSARWTTGHRRSRRRLQGIWADLEVKISPEDIAADAQEIDLRDESVPG